MRINRYIASYTGLSRRKADELIDSGAVIVNRKPAHPGIDVSSADTIVIDGKRLVPVRRVTSTVLLHKPVGYVCSRDGQGSPTVYDLLPKSLQHLNVAGRLDKDSSGLVIMTSDGQLLQELTHPSYNKEKVYHVSLNKQLSLADIEHLKDGVNIGDGRLSKLQVEAIDSPKEEYNYKVVMTEGRNRQIRRTFEALGFHVLSLHRLSIGYFELESISLGVYTDVTPK